jgi:hypothetical protein
LEGIIEMNKKVPNKNKHLRAPSEKSADVLPTAITELLERYARSLQALERSPKTIPWYIEILTRFSRFLQSKNLLNSVDKMGRQELREYLL